MNLIEELRALAETYGVPGVDLSEVVILIDDLEIIPHDICRSHAILPVLVRGAHLFLAMAAPRDKRVIDEIEFVTGKTVFPYAAVANELSKTIDAAFDARNRRARCYVGPSVTQRRLLELGVDSKGMRAPGARPANEGARTPLGLVMAPQVPLVTPLIPPPLAEHQGHNEWPAAVENENEEVLDGRSGPASRVIPSLGTSPRPSQRRGDSTKRILVVDDAPDVRAMLVRVLSGEGHRVVEAETGKAALESIERDAPDLVLLDGMLPGLHGFDVARRLKANPRFASIPIIMISAVYRGWRVAEDLKTSYGIFEYLEKPFRLAEVVDVVARALAPASADCSEAGPAYEVDILNEQAAEVLDEATAAERSGDIDRAILLLEKGTRLDPLAYRLRFDLAVLYGKKDKVFEGIGELERGIELNPKDFAGLKTLALLYERAAFKNRAVEMWERCVHSAPDALSRAQAKERLLELL